MPGVQVVDVDAGHDLAEHDHLLLGQLDRGDGVGLERVGRHVGRRRLVAVVGERPDRAACG